MHRHTAPGVGLLATVVALFIALGGCGSDGSSAAKAPPKPAEDLAIQASDFTNLHDMTKVRGFYVDNRLGHLKQALAMANSPKGGTYPVGTILQLVPQEAMVKRRQGFDPATKDWEFFFLTTDATGTKIVTRGTSDVVNRFGGNCAACHAAAAGRFDMVCEHDHGCAPLPVGDAVIHGIQDADPRPRHATAGAATSATQPTP
jgi:mono/diheme cytochrome c family protein